MQNDNNKMVARPKKHEESIIRMEESLGYIVDWIRKGVQDENKNHAKISTGIWNLLVNVTKRRCLWLCIGCVLLFGYTYTFFVAERPPTWYLKPAPCDLSLQKKVQMMEMLEIINYTLVERLGISYFLCFGTLWGAIRSKRFLSWDNNIDVCLLQHDISQFSNFEIDTAFAQVGISVEYSYINGVYTLRYGNTIGYITVFRQGSNDLTQRTGLAAYLLPFVYYNPIYPSWLTEKPLPVKDFLGEQYPVPRAVFEIMMYMYPGDWWRIMDPPQC